MRVLIVEDDARVARLLRTVLRRDGFETVLAERGDDGWRELTGAHPPLLLILDRMLPDMDGADLLARLRAEGRTGDLPVLMLTADIRTSRALDDGVLTRVLGKPFDLADFRATCAALRPGRPDGEVRPSSRASRPPRAPGAPTGGPVPSTGAGGTARRARPTARR